MYVVFVAGGIASGKSTVARELERLGARRIDLDQLSREVLEPSEPCMSLIADHFGHDLVDEAGCLNRALLAQRAFVSPTTVKELEGLELPFIKALLQEKLNECAALFPQSMVVVEVPLLDRMQDCWGLAQEIIAVTCPLELRCERAVARGMSRTDVEARAKLQPADEYLKAHATYVIENSGTQQELLAKVHAWWKAHSCC